MITVTNIKDVMELSIGEYSYVIKFMDVYSHLLSPNQKVFLVSCETDGLYCFVVETDVGCDVITIFHTKTKKLRCSIYRRGLSILRQIFGDVDGVGVKFRNKLNKETNK